jgi:hypothetical protein
MPGPSKRTSLTPQELDGLLAKLKEVTAEAERLREHVAQALSDQRRGIQQRIASPRPVRPHRKVR